MSSQRHPYLWDHPNSGALPLFFVNFRNQGRITEILKLQRKLQITPDMPIGKIMAVHPQAQQVLAGFHLGGCSSCLVDDAQTLAEAAAVNGRALEPILVALNTLVADNGNGTILPKQLKTPNIEL